MILLAGVPFLVILGAWNGLDLWQLATLFLLLASVGVGGGGMAVAASIVSRRGRNALLSVYILMLVLVLSPLLAGVGYARSSRRLVGIVQSLCQHEPPGLGQ